jgi:hypothetical protein
MKKMMLVAVSLTAITLFTSLSAAAQDDMRDEMNPGVWSAYINKDRVHVQFGGIHWNSGANFELSEMGTLPTGTGGTFAVKRDPGTVTFNGSWSNGAGHGTYVFVANPEFKSYLESEGFRDVPDALMIHLFFTNINKVYFAYMKENGYQGISISQLKDLAYQNMNLRVMTAYVELFKKEGYGKVSLEKMVELREHGVDPQFVSDLHQAGYAHVSLEKALEARDHGVTAEYINDMKKAGARDISLDEAIELRDHGVTTEYIQGFRDLGYKDLSLEKATELQDHGVTVEFIREFQRMGYKNVSPDRARELRDHGVEPSFVSGIKGLGFAELSLEKAIELQDHGVTVEFIRRMQEKGLKNLSLDEYVRLRDSGM